MPTLRWDELVCGRSYAACSSRLVGNGGKSLYRRLSLVNAGNQPGRTGSISLVRVAEVRAQQRLFCVDAGDKRRHQKCRDQDAHAGAEGQAPADRIREQAEI